MRFCAIHSVISQRTYQRGRLFLQPYSIQRLMTLVALLLWVLAVHSTSCWALEEASSNSNSAKEAPKATDEAEPLTRNSLTKLINEKKYDLAIERMDAALAIQPTDSQTYGLELLLAMGLRQAKPELASHRLTQLVDRLFSMTTLSPIDAGTLASATGVLASGSRNLPPEDTLALIDKTIAKLKSLNSPAISSNLNRLNSDKIRFLLSIDRAEEAKGMLDDSLSKSREEIDEDNKVAIGKYLLLATQYVSALKTRFPKESDEVISESNKIANDFFDRNDFSTNDCSPYFTYKASIAMALVAIDADRAQAFVDELTDSLKSLKERLSEDDAKKLATYQSSLLSLKSRVASALSHKRLIGTAAPEIDAEHFVEMQPVSMSDLKGKVVLIDFWAVWCGPCIATFPHLIEWHEKYASKGLVILGSTHRYNMKWDSEANKAVRVSKDETVALEDELEMLKKFREQHHLHHGFIVSPEQSSYAKTFGVYGIPQAVVIDQEGKVQLIKTGSGGENAVAIEAKIQELLRITP